MEKIDSVGHLEVLLLLHKDPDVLWTPESLSRELRTNVSMASNQLKGLMAYKLLNQGPQGDYYFDPTDPEDKKLTQELSEIYRERRIMIINLICSKAKERVKSLADAFKIRRGEQK